MDNIKIIPGAVYRHFKGFTATIITSAIHTETGERLVIYKCEGNNNGDHENGIYARPIDMFFSEVDKTKYPNAKQKYRFELISLPE